MTQVSDPIAMREASREDNGKFGVQPHAESGVVELWDPTDGSFAFPPIPKTPRDVINFWATVAIPDDALETMVRCSEEAAEAAEQGITDNILAGHGDLKFRVENGRASKADLDRWEDLRTEVEIALRNNAPTRLPHAYAKPLVRIASMAFWANYLPTDAQKEEVWSTPIKLPGSTITTPQTIWEAYKFSAFYDKATRRLPTEADRTEMLREMADSLAQLRDNSDTDADLRYARAERREARRVGRG